MPNLHRLIIPWMVFGFAPLAAQPIGGHQVRVDLTADRQLQGELLTITRDSLWVLDGGGRTLNAAMTDVNRILVERYRKSPAGALAWGLAVGLASGVGLGVACSSVDGGDGCGGVAASMIIWGGVIGGISALSIHMGRYREENLMGIPAYARFPQGPPPGLDLQALGVARSTVP